MKKPFSLFVLIATLFLIAACESEDLSVTIVVEGEEPIEEEVVYEEGDTLFDILQERFALDYEETDFGPMIEGVESLEAGPMTYIAIYKNDDLIDSGVDQVAFESGDTFRFEIAWLDENAKALDAALELFLDQQAASYLEDLQTEVVLGFYHLNKGLDIAPDFEYDEQEAGALANMVFVEETLEEASSELYEALGEKADTDWAYSASLYYMALVLSEDASLYGDFEDAFVERMNESNLEEKDNDTLSMMLLAMSVYDGEALKETKTEVQTLLEENVYDNLYGNNSASFALTLMALLSQGVDPTDEEYVDGGMNLLEHLLSHQMEDGSFKYTLDDDEADTMFSTPQAFLALCMMQKWYHGDDALHPFVID